ncbi:Uncharacterised protein [Mycobacterium tuberculosis]|uniref:Uncharacterized protein n=1 Tax=Mycobacterium tuberculosis TaxID=1773 RepID=A0A0U0RW07_MYCTX|nr:Uncharacterised protein [Mycobacterium tuberculosis]COW33232.1 Uncharacterised protein [Mycobacterium tuberculosis]COX08877.1 Uncharacterised protein [Mycobacterium tuberculosis]
MVRVVDTRAVEERASGGVEAVGHRNAGGVKSLRHRVPTLLLEERRYRVESIGAGECSEVVIE